DRVEQAAPPPGAVDTGRAATAGARRGFDRGPDRGARGDAGGQPPGRPQPAGRPRPLAGAGPARDRLAPARPFGAHAGGLVLSVSESGTALVDRRGRGLPAEGGAAATARLLRLLEHALALQPARWLRPCPRGDDRGLRARPEPRKPGPASRGGASARRRSRVPQHPLLPS